MGLLTHVSFPSTVSILPLIMEVCALHNRGVWSFSGIAQ